MNALFDFLGSLLRGVFRLLLLVLVSGFVLGFLLIGLTAALFALVWALITGRKPTAWTTFTRFRQASRQFQQGVWRTRGHAASGTPGASDADREAVVDVQAREVGSPSSKAQAPSQSPSQPSPAHPLEHPQLPRQ